MNSYIIDDNYLLDSCVTMLLDLLKAHRTDWDARANSADKKKHPKAPDPRKDKEPEETREEISAYHKVPCFGGVYISPLDVLNSVAEMPQYEHPHADRVPSVLLRQGKKGEMRLNVRGLFNGLSSYRFDKIKVRENSQDVWYFSRVDAIRPVEKMSVRESLAHEHKRSDTEQRRTPEAPASDNGKVVVTIPVTQESLAAPASESIETAAVIPQGETSESVAHFNGLDTTAVNPPVPATN